MTAPFIGNSIQLDPDSPCIGLMEYSSIADGIQGTDAMLKKAEIQILLSRPVHPGKYTTLITGMVDEVSEALQAAKELNPPSLVDFLFLPNVHDKVLHILHQTHQEQPLEALGILETSSIASVITAADLAVKNAMVELISMRLADDLGGKSFFTFTGEIGDLESAMETALNYVLARNTLVQKVVLPNPHPEMIDVLTQKRV